MKPLLWLALLGLGSLLVSAASGTAGGSSAQRKIQLIQSDKAPRGANITIPESELNVYVRQQVAAVAPDGVRDPKLDLGNSRATGYAYVDFPKLRQAQGKPMNPILAALFGGEHLVRVDARIQSANGLATIEVERVQVGDLALSGGALDYVIRHFLWSYYPDAKVGKPFELAHNVDRLEVRPNEVRIVMGK